MSYLGNIEMQIDSFEYTDAKGKVTQRTVAVLRRPSDLLEAIDVSELSSEEISEFAHNYNEILDDFKAQIANLQEEFDLKHNLRNFKPEKMTKQETWYV